MRLALQTQLSRIGACQVAVEWAGEYETLQEAWAACDRGDWMLWLCGKMIGKEGWPTHQAIVLAACDCAELVLPLYEQRYPADPRVRVCLAITRQWAAGNAAIEAVKVAGCAAYAAADAAADAAHAAYAASRVASRAAYATYAADAAHAAYAASRVASRAAYATYAAYAASRAASCAVADAGAPGHAAYAAAAVAAKQCADICRIRLQIGDLPL
jgi:hypothetical protein